jgi:3-mercaptopyruvate sulfurtransferase SseA
MKRLEVFGYAAALVVLSALIFKDGQKAAALEAQLPVSPKELYALLGNPKVKLQVVDLRPHDDDHFVDTHVPGAISLPDCAPDAAPKGAKEHAYPYVLTVIVSEEGDRAAFDKCRGQYAAARNLAGGMAAWSAANLPEDTGEYRPPKPSASGGCL